MLEVIWLIPAFPLAGFLLILLFGRRLGEPRSGYLAAAMVLASFVVAAAEVVVGLAIIVSILRGRPGATADDLAELKG